MALASVWFVVALFVAIPVVSKNTNELKTGAPGRFGLEVPRLGSPMEVRILGQDPIWYHRYFQ